MIEAGIKARRSATIAKTSCHELFLVRTLNSEMWRAVAIVLLGILGVAPAGDVAKPEPLAAPPGPSLDALAAPELDHGEHGTPAAEAPRARVELAGATDTMTNADHVVDRDGAGVLREATLDHSQVADAALAVFLQALVLVLWCAANARRRPGRRTRPGVSPVVGFA